MIALLIRDMRLAMRAGGGFGLGLAFFLLVAVLVPLGVGPNSDLLAKIAPGILWVGALLACLLSLDRLFALDYEDGSLDLLATALLADGDHLESEGADHLGGFAQDAAFLMKKKGRGKGTGERGRIYF